MAKIKIIRKEGGSRIISITDIIPLDWQIVEVISVKKNGNFIMLKIERVR